MIVCTKSGIVNASCSIVTIYLNNEGSEGGGGGGGGGRIK